MDRNWFRIIRPIMDEQHALYRFGPFELDTAAYELRRDGSPVAVEPRALDVLVHLVRRRDRVVTRDELVDAVWPGSFISDSALGQSVLKARRAVDDDGRRQEVIRTVHGRGLRFVAEVEVAGATASPAPAGAIAAAAEVVPPAPASERRRWRPAVLAAACALPVVAAVAWLTMTQPAETAATRLALLPFDNQTGDPTLAWIEDGLPRLMGRTLAERGGVEIVSDRVVIEMLERAGTDPNSLDTAGIEALARVAGATHAVTAVVSRQAELFRAEVTLWRDRRRPRRIELKAPRVPQLLDEVAGAVAEEVLGAGRAENLRAGFSDDPFVNRLYAMGLAEYRRDNYRGAESYFRVCLDREPDLHWARYELALCRRRLGAWDESLELSRQVLEAAAGAADWRLQAAVRHNMGIASWRLGDVDGAEQHYMAAAAIADTHGMRDVRAPVLLGLGILWADRGQLDRADGAERQALAVYREMGDHSGEAAALNSLGVLAWRRGDLETSREMHERALVMRRELGKRDHEAASLNNLGTIAQATGQWADADALFGDALAIRREVGDRGGQASTLYNLSALALLRSDPARSRRLAEEALTLARDLGDRRRMAWSLGQLAEVARREGDLDQAARRLEETLGLYRELGDRPAEAGCLLDQAQIDLDAGRPDAAAARCEDALAIANAVGDRTLEGRTARLLGAVAEARGDLRLAEERYRTALDTAREVGQSFNAMVAAVDLGHLLLDRGDVGELEALLSDVSPFLTAGHAPATLLLARLRSAQGRFDEAVALAERARDDAGPLWTPGDQRHYLAITAD